MKRILIVLALVALAGAARAELVSKALDYAHDGVALQGYLVYDDAVTGKRPGVLVVPEWWGLNDYAKKRADDLARMGYVALAADMYGKGVVTTDAKKAGELAGQFYGSPLMRTRARAGYDVLAKHEGIAAFENALRESKADWLLASYGGAVHSFTNPDAGKAGIPGVAYNEKAALRSWSHMKTFFDEIFARR